MTFSAASGIIHQIITVQADFFDKTKVIPCQGHARTAVEGHVTDRVVSVPGHDFHTVEVSDGLHQSSGTVVLMDAGEVEKPKYKWLPIG